MFSKHEQEIINSIVHASGFHTLTNIFNRFNSLPSVRVSVDTANKSVKYLFEIQGSTPTSQEISMAIDREDGITKEILKLLLLLDRLDKDDFAYFYKPVTSSANPIEFGAGAVNKNSIAMPINDAWIVNSIIKFLPCEVIPKSTLIHLCNNHFKTNEDIRLGKTLRITWITLAFSVAIGCYGIYRDYKNDQDLNIKFDKAIVDLDKNIQMLDSTIQTLKSEPYNYSPAIENISNELKLLLNKK